MVGLISTTTFLPRLPQIATYPISKICSALFLAHTHTQTTQTRTLILFNISHVLGSREEKTFGFLTFSGGIEIEH